jgi:LuxR family transcriptional activator of conjugal transfer of Ti plasmids
MTPIFQTFIDRLHGATETTGLREAMSGLADGFGLTKFAYLGFPRPHPHDPVLISTYPVAWTDHYFSRRYHALDPVVLQSRESLAPFIWDGPLLATRSREQQIFFGEASEFGIECGFAVPIHDGQGGLALVSFACDEEPNVLRRRIGERRDILHLSSLYFHVHVRQKLEAVFAPDRPNLSPREVACLQWIAKGKTMWDIGEILGISRRTIVFHLENAKRKLNAVTLAQAAAIALRYGLIEF